MAINFNALPSDKPNDGFALIPIGRYKAQIIKAEMKQPLDQNKPEYLNLTIECLDKNDKREGLIFDVITESAASLPMYKLGRLIKALELPMGDTFELKDLIKIVVNKPFYVDVNHDTYNGKEKAQVDISKEIYYPLDTAEATTDLKEALEDRKSVV